MATKLTTIAATAVAAAPPPPAPAQPKLLRRVILAIGGFLSKYLLSLCWFAYVFGFVWVLLHPAVTLSTGEAKPRGTYISENALLIDSFEPRNSHEETQAAVALHETLSQLPSVSERGCQTDCNAVVDWLATQLDAIDRVESYKQTFRPMGFTNMTHTNVYGILRAAPLADSKESLVLVTHYRNVGAQNGEYSGVALALALLDHLAAAKWLAKDVIVLFADDGPLDGTDGFAPGTEAWLHAYHVDPLQFDPLQPYDDLPMRAGVIRAAVNVETLGRSWDAAAIGVFVAGMNGQLPNLDLVNAAVMALQHEHVPVVLDRCTGQNDPHCGANNVVSWVAESLEWGIRSYVPYTHLAAARTYARDLIGLLRFMTTLARGPSGSHAHFVRYNIDALTLSAVASMDDRHVGTSPLSLRATLRAIEKIVRALSNLEEKLHQSFFLYVLPNTHHFVSVGEYYYAVALALAPAIAHLAALASRTIGTRTAFSLVVVVLVEVAAVALLLLAPAVLTGSWGGVFDGIFESGSLSGILPTGSSDGALPNVSMPIGILDGSSDGVLANGSLRTGSLHRTLAFVLAITVAQGMFVVWLVPHLQTLRVLSGCAERRNWRVRVRTYELKHRGDDKPVVRDGPVVVPPSPKSLAAILAKIPQQDTGWCGLKFVVMGMIVYAHCVLGVLNYPFALFCAAPMALFALVEPRRVTPQPVLKRIGVACWLIVSSPLVLCVIGLVCDYDGFLAAIAFVADSFAARINLLVLPYFCCLFVPVHTLSLAIWLSPIDDTATAADDSAIAAAVSPYAAQRKQHWQTKKTN